MDERNKKSLPWVTIALVAVNVVVFLITDLIFFREQNKVVYYMAMNPILVTKHGEYWRLLTSMFYHFNIEHVMFNMLSLAVVGAILEPFFGRIRFIILYFISGLLADVATIIYNSLIIRENAESVFAAGASGAVYGLLGAFVGILLFMRERLTKEECIRLPIMVFLLLFGNIFQKGVGHEAHFGGFFAGVLLGIGYCIYLRNRQDRDRRTKE